METLKGEQKTYFGLYEIPKIMLKTEKGKFLSRSTVGSNENVIVAYRNEACEHCKFSLKYVL